MQTIKTLLLVLVFLIAIIMFGPKLFNWVNKQGKVDLSKIIVIDEDDRTAHQYINTDLIPDSRVEGGALILVYNSYVPVAQRIVKMGKGIRYELFMKKLMPGNGYSLWKVAYINGVSENDPILRRIMREGAVSIAAQKTIQWEGTWRYWSHPTFERELIKINFGSGQIDTLPLSDIGRKKK